MREFEKKAAGRYASSEGSIVCKEGTTIQELVKDSAGVSRYRSKTVFLEEPAAGTVCGQLSAFGGTNASGHVAVFNIPEACKSLRLEHGVSSAH